MSFKFTPEDFKEVCDGGHRFGQSTSRDQIASYLANDKLDEWKKSWVRVYGANKQWDELREQPTSPDITHQAYLVEIEPIVKAECEHEPIEIDMKTQWLGGVFNSKLGCTVMNDLGKAHEKLFRLICNKCGKKLKATWSVVE